jgi:hypothetical protein
MLGRHRAREVHADGRAIDYRQLSQHGRRQERDDESVPIGQHAPGPRRHQHAGPREAERRHDDRERRGRVETVGLLQRKPEQRRGDHEQRAMRFHRRRRRVPAVSRQT